MRFQTLRRFSCPAVCHQNSIMALCTLLIDEKWDNIWANPNGMDYISEKGYFIE